MSHAKCQDVMARAEHYLAGGPATLSKHVSRYPMGIAPQVLQDGYGARVWCPDGHQFIDCVAGLGPILIGHSQPAILQAVRMQIGRLACSTMSTALEGDVAEHLCHIIPGAEHVRFACNGKDVTEAAVKLARYITGSDYVLYVGYSGGHPDYLSTTDKHGGVLPIVKVFNHQALWRDFADAEAWVSMHRDNIAAIMVEVPPEKPDVLREQTAAVLTHYRTLAQDAMALFILDEVVTGLRYGLGGAQAYYGVQADLVTMSKALGNGYPISAILGPRDYMQAFEGGRVFLSTTFGGSPIGLAACKAVLTMLQETDALANLEARGTEVWQHIRTMLANMGLPATVRGNYARFVIDWQGVDGIASADGLRTLWLQELIAHGVLAGVPYFPMTCWDADVVAQLCEAVRETCVVMADVVQGRQPIADALRCPVITDVFQQRYQAPCGPS